MKTAALLLAAVLARALPPQQWCDPGKRPCPPCNFPPPLSSSSSSSSPPLGEPAAAGGHVKYLSFYGFDPDEQAGWASLGISRNISLVKRGAARGFDHLLDIELVLFSPNNGNGRRLLPGYMQRWQRLWETIRPQLHSLRLIGVFLGDELVANGMPSAHLAAAADAVRHSWRNATIYANEGWTSIVRKQGGANWTDGKLPANLSWISYDWYEYSSQGWLRPECEYKFWLYPMMHPTQRAVLVPQAFGSSTGPRRNSADPGSARHKNWSRAQYDDWTAAVANAYWEWAARDKRVVGINPYWCAPARTTTSAALTSCGHTYADSVLHDCTGPGGDQVSEMSRTSSSRSTATTCPSKHCRRVGRRGWRLGSEFSVAAVSHQGGCSGSGRSSM